VTCVCCGGEMETVSSFTKEVQPGRRMSDHGGTRAPLRGWAEFPTVVEIKYKQCVRCGERRRVEMDVSPDPDIAWDSRDDY
jgi:hypothetical protein